MTSALLADFAWFKTQIKMVTARSDIFDSKGWHDYIDGPESPFVTAEEIKTAHHIITYWSAGGRD